MKASNKYLVAALAISITNNILPVQSALWRLLCVTVPLALIVISTVLYNRDMEAEA